MAETSLKETALAYFQEAYRAQIAGELDQAIELYKRSIEIYPTAEAHTFLGWTYSFQNRIDEAIEECHRAIAVDNTFGNPYNDIGAYLIEKGDYFGAIPWLKKAMVAPRYECYFYPHFNLGRIYEGQGQYLAAIAEYSRALEYNPKYISALRAVRKLQRVLN
ncbi:MAG: tetratricopeptide repeat protein [Acidobacteriota bacterium]